MEQGSLRCDVNISLNPAGDLEWGTRTETKNVNSLRSVERAVRYEMRRQAAVLDEGGRVLQETRHFHEDTGTTSSGRSKEEATDYRYFPEPDLVPLAPDAAWIEELRAGLPELPAARRSRLQQEWGISGTEMTWLANAGALGLVEETVAAGASPADAGAWPPVVRGDARRQPGAAGDLPVIDAARARQPGLGDDQRSRRGRDHNGEEHRGGGGGRGRDPLVGGEVTGQRGERGQPRA